jgi:hypothetical protein
MGVISFHSSISIKHEAITRSDYLCPSLSRGSVGSASSVFHTKLAGGESAGFPMGVTYAEESPPSTVKSVPFKAQHEIREEGEVLTINAYRYVATLVVGH